jgi:hypothetical protein
MERRLRPLVRLPAKKGSNRINSEDLHRHRTTAFKEFVGSRRATRAMIHTAANAVCGRKRIRLKATGNLGILRLL